MAKNKGNTGVPPNGGTGGFDSVRYRNDFIRTHYDRITLAVKKGKKDEWNSAAKAQDLSLSEYITRKVDGEI